MNHPDGECPLCLYPLVDEDEGSSAPFMKLMSCFHCECIIRWWNWLELLKNLLPLQLLVLLHLLAISRIRMVRCDESDALGFEFYTILLFILEIVWEIVDICSLFEPDLQQEKGGLIEIKKHEVLRPGIFLPQPAAVPSTASNEDAKDLAANSRTNSSGSSNKPSEG
ncbi:hypothetical protein RND71_001347 [Anisodus tanguticus]|uniref:Uncharacterized protein n=1 Tax=Anisodus tanguticus TaxID=243964 RepID=A0AAE1T025_9SOLA|nr:hypothetical protein RND71_001347 [Anisodus tanguticus]